MEQPKLKRSTAALVWGIIASAFLFTLASAILPVVKDFFGEIYREAISAGDYEAREMFSMLFSTLDTLITAFQSMAVINLGLIVLAYFFKIGCTLASIWNVLMLISGAFVLVLLPFIFNCIAISRAKKAHVTYRAELKAFQEFSAQP